MVRAEGTGDAPRPLGGHQHVVGLVFGNVQSPGGGEEGGLERACLEVAVDDGGEL